MKSLVLVSVVLLTDFSCATNPNVVKSIDTKMDVKGNVGSSKLGLNDKNEVIVQEERQAQDELLIQESVNMRLQDEVDHYEGELRECLKYRADSRLGGNGEMPEIPDVSNLKPDEDTQEEFGSTDDGSLKVVRKSFFVSRLKNARIYEKSMRSITKVLKKQNEACQMKLEVARNKAGLPGKKVTAEGYFNSKGTWVETKSGENSVGDAFEIQADHAQKAGK